MTPESAKISKIFGEEPVENKTDDAGWMGDVEGQLALDAYQTADSVVVKAPIAGVKPEDIEVSIVDDSLTIKGERKQDEEIQGENYLAQECYWGSFSRQITLPPSTDKDRAKASLKNGVLTIRFPKEPESKTKVLKITAEE